MKPFQNYANYYDILYQEKDYQKECDFLEEIFKKYSDIPVKTILNLGCGTGSHDLILAEGGYQITGVDLSSKMLEIARKKAEEQNKKIDFIEADIRNFELERKFDTVISMFAVISYLTENKDIISAFKKAAKHLNKNGIFTFDCWFGPTVLSQKPEKREKIIEQGKERIKRIAVPNLDILNQTVDVNYQLFRGRGEKVLENIQETHKIRFFFPQEIKNFLEQADLQLIRICPFMELDKTPTEKDWNITVIARK